MRIMSKDGIYKPKVYSIEALHYRELLTVQEALQSPKWKAVMEEEYTTLLKNNTWSLVPNPIDRKIVGCKWVYKLKGNTDVSIASYKS